MTPDLPEGTDVTVDADDLDKPRTPLTTDEDQKSDDLDSSEGEEGSA